MLSALRGGHVPLNGEVKFRFLTRKCMLQRCVGGQRECILHFIFLCRHFLEERRRFERVVDAAYRRMTPPQSWLTLSETERWQRVLFPLQADISKCRSKEVLQDLIAVRIEILFALVNYVFETKRFPETKVDKTFYEL